MPSPPLEKTELDTTLLPVVLPPATAIPSRPLKAMVFGCSPPIKLPEDPAMNKPSEALPRGRWCRP